MNKLSKIIFLVLIFSISINIVLSDTDNKCIFKYLTVKGDGICELNCSGPVIKVKENSNLCITPNPDVKIYYRPIGEQEQPQEAKRKNLSDTLCIIQPTFNFGYNYWVVVGESILQNMRIQVITYDEYEKSCVKKQGKETKRYPTLPPENITSEEGISPKESNPKNNCNIPIINNQGTVNVNCGNEIVNNNNFIMNFLIKFRIQIITTLSLLTIGKFVIDFIVKKKYQFNKSKKLKHKKF